MEYLSLDEKSYLKKELFYKLFRINDKNKIWFSIIKDYNGCNDCEYNKYLRKIELNRTFEKINIVSLEELNIKYDNKFQSYSSLYDIYIFDLFSIVYETLNTQIDCLKALPGGELYQEAMREFYDLAG